MDVEAAQAWPADDPRIDEILAIVAKETGIDQTKLTPQTRFADLGVASIDMVQSVFAIESRFNIEIPIVTEQDGQEFATVGDFVRRVIEVIGPAA